MASRGQQVRPIFGSISQTQPQKFKRGLEACLRRNRPESGQGANFVIPFLKTACTASLSERGHRRLNPRCVTLETHAFHLDHNHVALIRGQRSEPPCSPLPKPDIPLRCAAPVFPGSRWPKRVSDIGIQSYASAPSQRNCVLRAAEFLI